jgi:hypothetical protein
LVVEALRVVRSLVVRKLEVSFEIVVVARVDVPIATREPVVVELVNVAFVAVRELKIAVATLASVEKNVVAVKSVDDALPSVACPVTPSVPPTEVLARVVLPLNVLSPAKVCVPVETTPREEAPALGMLMVWVEPIEEIATSLPDVPATRN